MKRFVKRLGLALFFWACVHTCVHASVVNVRWNANTEDDLAGYRFCASSMTMMGMSTTTAMSRPNITKRTLGLQTTYQYLLGAGTTVYFRLTAFDTAGNESEFNVDFSSAQAQLAVFMKPGDVNGDDAIGISDLGALLVDYVTGYNPRSDFDNDGFTDINDLSRLLANWGK